MRIDDIGKFVEVARSGSLVRAASELGASQPTLSKAIARLERALKVQLVERHSRGVRLTEAGNAFLPYAAELKIDHQDGVTAIRELRHGYSGTLKFGVGSGIPQTLVASACSAALRQTKLTLEISGGMAHALSRSVVGGEIEFAVVGVQPPRDHQLTWEPLFADPILPLAPRDHPLASARNVSWQALAKERWILSSEDTVTRRWFDQQFRNRGIDPPEHVIMLRDSALPFELASAVNAPFLAPASFKMIAQSVFGHKVVRMPTAWQSNRTVGILHRRNHKKPAARALINSFKMVAQSSFRGEAA